MAGKAPASRGADYFSQRHSAIFSALQRRCAELHATDQQELWGAFSNTFNRAVAGRYPFALLNVKETPDADFEDLSSVIKSFERLPRVWSRESGPSGKRSSSSGYAVQRFYDQFDKVRNFLAPLYPADEGSVPGYDLLPEFRVNQIAEVEGNKVIDWTLEVGSQTLKLRDAPRPLRWEPGAPIVLTLRLAKDSTATAMADSLQPNMTTDGKVVTYRYPDAWALLRFIQRQRDSDASLRSDSRSQLLRFEFPLSGVAEGGTASGQEIRGRLFMRLSVLPVGKRTPLAWPSVFPVRAPELGGLKDPP
jgi:type VI secretion system protein ImpL